jgi:hypothetical protein
MRRIILATTITLAILAVQSLVPNRAEAMPVTTPADILGVLKDTNVVQEIACRRVWRCGPYGCGWRAVCWADPYSHPGTYYGGFYNYYGGVPLRWSHPYRSY